MDNARRYAAKSEVRGSNTGQAKNNQGDTWVIARCGPAPRYGVRKLKGRNTDMGGSSSDDSLIITRASVFYNIFRVNRRLLGKTRWRPGKTGDAGKTADVRKD